MFDGPPGPVSGRFVEVEDATGASIRAGEWVQDGVLWRLWIPRPDLDASEDTAIRWAVVWTCDRAHVSGTAAARLTDEAVTAWRAKEER